MEKMIKLHILGTEYDWHEVNDDEFEEIEKRSGLENSDGIHFGCDAVVYINLDRVEKYKGGGERLTDGYKKHVRRHELLHAFACTSGFDERLCEGVIEWIATHLPKIITACEEVGAL